MRGPNAWGTDMRVVVGHTVQQCTLVPTDLLDLRWTQLLQPNHQVLLGAQGTNRHPSPRRAKHSSSPSLSELKRDAENHISTSLTNPPHIHLRDDYC